MSAHRDGGLLDFLQKLQGYKTNWSFDAIVHLSNFILGAWCYFAVKLNQPLCYASHNGADRTPALQAGGRAPGRTSWLLCVHRLGEHGLTGPALCAVSRNFQSVTLLRFNKILYRFLV